MEKINLAEKNMKKNLIWNLLGASSNAITSLFFMVIVTRVNGIEDSGVFTLAFSLACLICIIGGYQGRIFQVTDVNKEFNDKEYIFHRFVTFVIMMLIAGIYVFFKGYSTYKAFITLLLCLLKGLEVLADVFYGVIQKNGFLYQAGISLTMKSVLSIVFFALIDYFTNDLVLSCMVLCLIWFILFLFYDLRISNKLISKDRLDILHSLKIFKSGFFAFSILFLSVYLINAPKYALDGNVSETIIAIYGIILMPATLLSLSAQYILQPFLPKLSTSYYEKKYTQFNKLVSALILMVVMIGVVTIIGGYLFGLPVLGFIYSVDLNDSLVPFMTILVGAIFYALGILLSAVLTTIRRTRQQFIIYIFVSIFAFVCSTVLVEKQFLFGASLAYFLIMFLQFISYFLYYKSVISKSLDKNDGGAEHGRNNNYNSSL